MPRVRPTNRLLIMFSNDCHETRILIDTCFVPTELKPNTDHRCLTKTPLNARFNEHECTYCRPSCASLVDPSKECTLECWYGCQCLPGFVLNDQGICVPPEKCQASRLRAAYGPWAKPPPVYPPGQRPPVYPPGPRRPGRTPTHPRGFGKR